MSSQAPYWRLSGFYFFYFAVLGVSIPYWSLYLKSLGFPSAAIGGLVAIPMATKIVAPLVWGWLADHLNRRMMIVRLAALLASLCFIGAFVTTDYWPLVVVIATFSFFWNAALPQFEANTLNHLRGDSHLYSRIRLWGSFGFIFSVVILGHYLDEWGIQSVVLAIWIALTAIWLVSLLVREAPQSDAGNAHISLLSVLRQRKVLLVLVLFFLAQLSHGPYYAFFSIFLKQHDYSSEFIGWLWAFGVAAEIVVFLFMPVLFKQFGPRNLLMYALGLTFVRWLLIAFFIEQQLVLWLAQSMHMFSFGMIHALAIYYVHELFVGRHQSRGQALYSSLSFGTGGALGSYLAGYFWDSLGGQWIYVAAACVALFGCLLASRYLPEHLQPIEQSA